MTDDRDDLEISQARLKKGDWSQKTRAELEMLSGAVGYSAEQNATAKAELYLRNLADRREIEDIAARREAARMEFDDALEKRREAFELEMEGRRESGQRQMAERQERVAKWSAFSSTLAALATVGLFALSIWQFLRLIESG